MPQLLGKCNAIKKLQQILTQLGTFLQFIYTGKQVNLLFLPIMQHDRTIVQHFKVIYSSMSVLTSLTVASQAVMMVWRRWWRCLTGCVHVARLSNTGKKENLASSSSSGCLAPRLASRSHKPSLWNPCMRQKLQSL